MPTFVLKYTDRPDSLDKRSAMRDAHLANINASRDIVRLAGPYMDDDGRMLGTIYLIDAPDLAAVEAFSARDPYRAADFYERVEITPWRIVIGELA